MKSTYFGLTSFQKSEQTLQQARTLVQNTLFPVVLGFEYYPVAVFGSNHPHGEERVEELTESAEELRQRGMHICESSRKGPAQIHSPGQLVIYPVVPLGHLKISPDQFVDVLRSSVRSWLASLKIAPDAAIANIIDSEEAGISQYAVAINISNDLKLLALAKASSAPMDSVEKQGKQLELKEAFDSWVLHFTHFLLQAIPAQKV